ncbi:MAG: O-antigen ligase family protein [Tissierellales bacterium]|nr:O-antigen ligase family protein [Tissierellales bacterium]MBN2828265.1 O-antigen ligase family protein [Tissierellales bacterium]
MRQDYFVAASYSNAKIYALHLNSLTYLIPYVFFKTLNKDGKQIINLIALIMGSLTALLSLRRGIILSAIIGTVLTIIITVKFRNIKITKVLAISFISIVAIFVLFHFSNVDIEKYFDAITSSFDFSNNRSNTIRTEQFSYLIDKIKDNPIFGHGIGAYDPNYYRSESNPANFELQYIKMIFASGFLGFFLNLAFVTSAFYSTLKLYRRSDFHRKMLLPALAAWIATLVYNASNPLITQLGPYFMFFHIFYIINSLKNDQSQIPNPYLK